MHSLKLKHLRSRLAMGALASLLGAVIPSIAIATDLRAPAVPSDIAVPEGAKVHFHGYAQGVQIYTWDGLTWGPALPSATLYDTEGNVVASHYAGPTWESNSGSLVVGTVVPPRITVDPDSIPWLLLKKARAEGPGIFAQTAYIHRVNTVGGKAPSIPGAFVGQTAEVPYAADYFFYRDSSNN